MNNINKEEDKAYCINCGREIEPLSDARTDKELEEFWESNYDCNCGEMIAWSNQVTYKRNGKFIDDIILDKKPNN